MYNSTVVTFFDNFNPTLLGYNAFKQYEKLRDIDTNNLSFELIFMYLLR